VALAAVRDSPERFSRVAVLDASPSARPDGTGSEQSRDVLALLRGLPRTFRSRGEFVAAVEAGGQPRFMAQWLAMNLVPEAGGTLRWSLELEGMESLFRSVLTEDDWDVVSSLPEGVRLTFIIGGGSGVVEAPALTQLAQLPRVRVEVIPGAGHWLHVDAPDQTFAALERALLD
jgi:pimeloyl-ACP methyl ester carboxylesterase